MAAMMPGPCKELQQHQWSSGRIHRCHQCDPGSIPGWCKCTLSCICVCLLHTMANFGNAVKDGHGGGRISLHLEHPALVGWEEWGKRQTGNGKGKHEMAGPV